MRAEFKAFAVIVTWWNAFPKQAMEMTEYGKHGKPRSRLSTLPTLLGNPFGITTFPRPRLVAYLKVQERERPNPRPLDLKGVVTEVLGPKCNERSGTLTPLRSFCCCSNLEGSKCQTGHGASLNGKANLIARF
jgi:hypothetical protein